MGFGGEVAGFYQRYRRGYPAEVIDGLVEAFGLTLDDVVVDLGCGTGQLALPLAERVRTVIGMDPEPDMLAEARRVAADRSNLSWMVGSDADVSMLGILLGKDSLGAVTIGQALHWMDHDRLFQALRPLLRPGGGVAVVTNGTPLWLQDSDWSRALRRHLELWLDSEVTATCGTDEDSRTRYADSLAAAGFTVARAASTTPTYWTSTASSAASTPPYRSTCCHRSTNARTSPNRSAEPWKATRRTTKDHRHPADRHAR